MGDMVVLLVIHPTTVVSLLLRLISVCPQLGFSLFSNLILHSAPFPWSCFFLPWETRHQTHSGWGLLGRGDQGSKMHTSFKLSSKCQCCSSQVDILSMILLTCSHPICYGWERRDKGEIAQLFAHGPGTLWVPLSTRCCPSMKYRAAFSPLVLSCLFLSHETLT